MDAVINFDNAWKEISEKNMRGVWEPLLKRKEAPIDLKIDEIVNEVVNLSTALDFELTAEQVQESLTFDNRDLENEDLYEINQPKAFEVENQAVEQAEEQDENTIPENPSELSYKQLKEIVLKGQEFTNFIKDLDPVYERQSKITKNIENSLKCYREEAKEKEKNAVKQTKIGNFFTKLNKHSDQPGEISGASGQTSGNPNMDEDRWLELSSSDED